jgi:predicted dehydrogenase
VLRHKASNKIPQYSNGCFSSIEDALLFVPQIAVIANPASHHISIAKKLAEIGTHLLIEKPLSNNLEGISELIEICQKQNSCLLTGYNLRYLPSLKYFRELIGKNIIGNVLSYIWTPLFYYLLSPCPFVLNLFHIQTWSV